MQPDYLTLAIHDLEQWEANSGRTLTGQQRIDWLNRRMCELGHNPQDGIIAGDGFYYVEDEANTLVLAR